MEQARPRTIQAARWVFVYNNPPSGWAPPQQASEVAYMVWQRERGKEGTEHIQGYIRFNTRKRFNTVKNYFSVPEIHVEAAKGTEDQNFKYCTKEDTRVEGPWIFGEANFKPDAGKQGNRTDIHAATDMIKQGSSMKDLSEAHPEVFVKYHMGLREFADLHRPLPPLERDVRVYWLWGQTGTGKTHRARTTFPEAYEVKTGRDPWGTYTDQLTVIFDEFEWDKWPIQQMNRYLDKWRCELDARYKDKWAHWVRVIIISNEDPLTFWPLSPPNLRQAIWRRIGTCVEVMDRDQVVKFE